MKVPQEFADTYGLEPQLEMECAKRKLHIPDDMEKKGEIVVPQFFIDSNHHMNNEKYVMLAQQLLPTVFIGPVCLPRDAVTTSISVCFIITGGVCFRKKSLIVRVSVNYIGLIVTKNFLAIPQAGYIL